VRDQVSHPYKTTGEISIKVFGDETGGQKIPN
jgi:hypothetical protein